MVLVFAVPAGGVEPSLFRELLQRQRVSRILDFHPQTFQIELEIHVFDRGGHFGVWGLAAGRLQLLLLFLRELLQKVVQKEGFLFC